MLKNPLFPAIATLFSFTYFILLILIFYASFDFYRDLESKIEFSNVSSVTSLKNLYLTMFILQMLLIFLSLVGVVFVTQKQQ